jgi:hypothetical protein
MEFLEDKTITDKIIEKLNRSFEQIQLIISEMKTSQKILSDKITQFKTMYTELVKMNQTKIFIFCLDSLYFQYKSSFMDLEAMENNRKFIMNRMYCDYYKLYHIIVSELNDKKILQIELKTYPQYKDLDVLYEYKNESIQHIHSDILLILHKLYEKYKNNQMGVQEHIDSKKSVLSISNFLNTLKFENGLLENQIMLYINYMAFFQFTQKKMLIKLYNKMSDFNKDIDEYLNFKNIISIDDINSNTSESVKDNIDEYDSSFLNNSADNSIADSLSYQNIIITDKSDILDLRDFTPLNGMPSSVPLDIQCKQLPINKLNGTPQTAASPISNLHQYKSEDSEDIEYIFGNF